MQKQQKLLELFEEASKTQNGEIDHEQFGQLIVALGHEYIYPGTIKKMIRKMNYLTQDKQTINLEQTKEYVSSFDTPTKHQIWKQKYTILEQTNNIRKQMKSGAEGAYEAAAPGAKPVQEAQDNTVQEVGIKVLVGQHKPFYSSEIDIEVDKNDTGPKVKPFIKLNFTYKSNEKAKKMEVLFKQTFNKVLELIGEEQQDFASEVKNFHINSMCQGNSATFFITTVNEELVSLIQLISELFELSFDTQGNGKCHVKFEFDYDFEKFFTNTNTNFHDILLRSSRIMVSARAQHFLREFRKLFSLPVHGMLQGCEAFEKALPIGLFHMDNVEADIEFDSFEGEQEYELDTKEELYEGLKEIMEMFMDFEEKGVKVRELLELMDADITIDASVGEWHAKGFFRLLNLNKVFLKALADEHEQKEENQKPGLVMTKLDEMEETNQMATSAIKASPNKSKLKKKDSLNKSFCSNSSDSES